VLKRLFACALLLTLAAPARAQQQTAAAAGDDDRKNQVQMFEVLLARSVESGGRTATDEARKVVPGLQLIFEASPQVRGWWSPGIGYQYYVELPNLIPTQLLTWNQLNQLRQGQGQNNARQGQGQGQGTPVNNGVRTTDPQNPTVQSQITAGDPMTKSPEIRQFDLAEAYRDAVYAALYNVVLDNSGGLPIKDEEMLQVVSAPVPGANFLYPDSRKLVLQIRGADLKAYHEHKINKDEARQRIVETRF